MAEKKWHSIQVVKGSGGYGGPLTITPTEQKHKFIYVTGGNRPAIVDKIAELTGMEAVDGFKNPFPKTKRHWRSLTVAERCAAGFIRRKTS